MYKCLSCKAEISLEQVKDTIRCPYCGYRVVQKERPNNPKKVLAR